MEDDDKEAIIRAKQAVSPAGLGDRSDKATTLPGNSAPEDTPLSGMDPTPSDDELDEDEATTTHHNRNHDGKVDTGKPPYS